MQAPRINDSVEGSRFPSEKIPASIARELTPGKLSAVLLLVVCTFLVYGVYVIREYKQYTWALYDPGWMVSTVMSIVEDGDLDLRNQLKSDPNQAADQTAKGKHGEWYPLHEFVMPVMTVPFYLLFGIKGCLLFNILISVLLMVIVFYLCARHVDLHSAFTATVLTAFPTLFFNYTYSYSLDVFSALLLIVACWLVLEDRFVLAGFVWGLAVYARLANVVTLPGFLVYFLSVRDLWNSRGFTLSGRMRFLFSPLLRFLAGGLPVLLCFLASNWIMFGSPTTTSYDRWQYFVDGQTAFTSQRGAFSCSFIERIKPLFVDKESGLIVGAPLLIVAVALGLRSYWQNARREMLFSAVICLSLIVLFTKYCNAVPGEPGNRYLMPVVALCAVPLSYAIRNCFSLGTSSKEHR